MNTHAPPVRLTERERTVLEMLAAGYLIQDIATAIDIPLEEASDAAFEAIDSLSALSCPHAIALAIRGGHIL